MENPQNTNKWWTFDRTFVIGVGFAMAAAFGFSFFAPQGSRTGSALVPPETLQKLIHNGSGCQTMTDEEVTAQMPPRQC
ncbi:MAG TPA: hypothetical protein VGF45_03110 [Polyangia bacterium]